MFSPPSTRSPSPAQRQHTAGSYADLPTSAQMKTPTQALRPMSPPVEVQSSPHTPENRRLSLRDSPPPAPRKSWTTPGEWPGSPTIPMPRRDLYQETEMEMGIDEEAEKEWEGFRSSQAQRSLNPIQKQERLHQVFGRFRNHRQSAPQTILQGLAKTDNSKSCEEEDQPILTIGVGPPPPMPARMSRRELECALEAATLRERLIERDVLAVIEATERLREVVSVRMKGVQDQGEEELNEIGEA